MTTAATSLVYGAYFFAVLSSICLIVILVCGWKMNKCRVDSVEYAAYQFFISGMICVLLLNLAILFKLCADIFGWQIETGYYKRIRWE